MNKKTIIVTGGFGTIGFALSKSLLEQGHKVVIVDTKIKKFKFNKHDAFVIKTNLNKENEIKKLISLCVKKFKKIDALVHCAYPRTNDWGVKLDKLKQKSLNKLNKPIEILSATLVKCFVLNIIIEDRIVIKKRYAGYEINFCIWRLTSVVE